MNDTSGPSADVPGLAVRIAFTRPGARELYAAGGGLPAPATPRSAGVDLRACLDAPEARIPAGGRLAVPTGISVQPAVPGWAGFVCSRSGLGARDGLTVAQGVGLIDPDYTGEIRVYLLNTSGEERLLRRGERVAQLVFQPYARPAWEEVPELSPTGRGAGGFGHTGR
ncbi:MAG: dUTP diphosphatase [Desulfovibrio sp.]|nr:dUTP diphosphatase [Desulfovibrio sp.]